MFDFGDVSPSGMTVADFETKLRRIKARNGQDHFDLAFSAEISISSDSFTVAGLPAKPCQLIANAFRQGGVSVTPFKAHAEWCQIARKSDVVLPKNIFLDSDGVHDLLNVTIVARNMDG